MSEPHAQPTSPSTTSAFQCAHINDLGGVTLETSGRLDADSATRLEELLRGALTDATLVVLDLQAVVLIDPNAVTAIVRTHQDAHANGRRLVIIGPPNHVGTALKHAGAEGALNIIDYSDAARIDPRSVGRLELDIQPSPSPGAPHILVACRGEIDRATAPQLRDAIAGLELGNVIVDLTGTSFMDSTGLSTLLNALRRLTRQEHRLVVICPPGPVRDVLRLTALLETLNVVDDHRAAERVMTR